MSESRPWFKAKTYGWGWGAATTWQGWLAYACYAGLMVANGVLFPPHRSPGSFIACTAVLSAGLIGVCLLKGEKPKWRWGR